MGQGAEAAVQRDIIMNWTSWDAFWHMGGYGLYVWGSYGATLVVMLLEPMFARARLKAAGATEGIGAGST